MSDLKNLQEHNQSKLNILSDKISLNQNSIEKEVILLETKIYNFIKNELNETSYQLSLLNVKIKQPILNINKENIEKTLEIKPFERINKKVKGSMFKNFSCALFTGFATSFLLFTYQLSSLGLLSSNIQESYSINNKTTVFNSISNIFSPLKDVSGEIILGTITSLLVILLFVISEKIRNSKLIKLEKKVEEDIEEYSKYIEEKIYTYSDISEFLKEISSQIDTFIVLLNEENCSLKRINFMKDDNETRPDLKTVKDISRIQALSDKINELISINILDDENEVSLHSKETLRESLAYIEKHMKKLYKEED